MEIKDKVEKLKDFAKDKASSVVDFAKEKIEEVKKSDTYANVTNTVFNDEFHDQKAKLLDKIKEYNTIIIHHHSRPDGDAIGSSIGLRELIKLNFPEKAVYSVGGNVPEYLQFIGKEDEIADSVYDGALAIVVDTSVEDRICDNRYKLAKEIIKIDHHFGDDNYGNINYVREDYCACAMVIADIFNSFLDKYEFNKEAARALYIGIVTDSGRFRYAEVDSKALKISARLLEENIDTQDIYTNLYTKDMEAYKFQSFVYDNVKFSEDGVAYLYISKKTMKKYHISKEDGANTVNTMDGIKGSMIWLLFIEYDNEIRIRLRSRYISLLELAGMYGGGGHENACGASIKKKNQIKEVVKNANEVLKNFKENNPEKF